MKILFEKSIICHVTGMIPSFRQKILSKYQGNPELEIIDLDEKADIIKNDKKMSYLFKQWELFKEKKNNKYKSIEKEMDLYWFNSLADFIVDIVKKYENKRLIFLGDNTHFRHLSKKVDIPTGNKFYLQVSSEELCTETVQGYLDNYQNDIINGSFPLSFLDHKFILERRKRINKIYHKWDYQDKNEDQIFDFLELSLNQKKMDLLDHLYISSKIPYYLGADIYPDKGKSLFAYSNPWNALFTLIQPKLNISYGIKKGKPFIKEDKQDEFKKLKFKGYLYQVDKVTFLPISQKNNMKFKSTLPSKIFKKEKFFSLTSVCRKHNIDCLKFD